jgi:hypothetical protein
MIRTLRAFFLGRLLREKVLLLVFVLIGALWWLTAFNKRATIFWREKHQTTVELADQTRWLQNEEKIKADADRAAKGFDPSRTLDANRLVGAINDAASKAGLKNNYGTSGMPTTETNGQLKIHTVQYNVTGADFEMLERFYLNLHKLAPYVGVESFALVGRGSNSPLLNLQLRVSSVELPR